MSISIFFPFYWRFGLGAFQLRSMRDKPKTKMQKKWNYFAFSEVFRLTAPKIAVCFTIFPFPLFTFYSPFSFGFFFLFRTEKISFLYLLLFSFTNICLWKHICLHPYQILHWISVLLSTFPIPFDKYPSLTSYIIQMMTLLLLVLQTINV